MSTAAYGTNTAFVNGASAAGEYAYDVNGDVYKRQAIQSTAHGVQRIAGTTATRGGVLSVNEVRVTKSVGKAFTCLLYTSRCV